MLKNRPFAPEFERGQTSLRILATTDLHMWMLGYDYYRDQPDTGHSLAQLAPLIDERRNEVPNACLFDNGDLLQGTPMADILVEDWRMDETRANPVMQTLTQMGYDAATLGNHDFNFGLPYLDAAVQTAGFPYVCANALRHRAEHPDADQPYLPPYTLLTRSLRMADGSDQDIRIGVIGFVPPQITAWDRQHLSGRIQTRSIIDSARFHVPRLKNAGADIIVALCHSGLGRSLDDRGQENAGLALATVPNIDAFVLGHVHRTFPDSSYDGYPGVDPSKGTICGKPAVMPGFWGSHLGIIDLTLEHAGDRWSITQNQSRVEPVTAAGQTTPTTAQPLAARVQKSMQAAHDRTLDLIRSPVGRLSGRLHSYFGEIGPTLVECLISAAKQAKCRELITQRSIPDLPILCMTSPFKSGGLSGPTFYTDIPAGPLALHHVAEMYIYPNTLMVIRQTGAQVLDLLERSAALFTQIKAGDQDVPLVSSLRPHYEIDWMHGLSYTLNLEAQAGANRVKDVIHQSEPIDPEADYIVATNNYRVAVAQVPIAPEDILYEAPMMMRDVLCDYLKSHQDYAPIRQTSVRFQPFSEHTTCRLSIGPAARDLIDQDPAMSVIGETPSGFLDVRYNLPAVENAAANRRVGT
ncbi:bifunctional 2',3'-cyclic-nucleotide 2'-phosphodiesterase/3'-nucleotidase [Shimia ponticola]|uniref:bifunctional 2',3'-cyclic-nucleotide 2'-phosphodiesterase/3'-nucleotidase n=1 Tax=Shimia ponticola TaxID=2582893 RepID=UPI0011BD69E8|nr:bifunctional 2',3'-cyclic-nucleotide 2'-phosphodiesterase/3'-nucleotidase [Shimia ponticola]